VPTITFGDISEHQPNVNQRAYRDAGYAVLIFRTHNGWRRDNVMPDRLAAARATGFVAIGLYQYVVAGRDAAEQAYGFIASIPGGLRANEFPIGDFEEGSGNQRPRANSWFSIVDKWAGFRASLYSGESFCNEHLGGWASWARPRWIAAYRSTEPTVPHEWWQDTATARFPGLGHPIDGNVFHGTAARFLEVVRPGAAKPPKPKPPEPIVDDGEHTGMSWLVPQTAPGPFSG
jgi:GH25 family lysozyme M1 (1,4-beta-N-acetylmuramidase)